MKKNNNTILRVAIVLGGFLISGFMANAQYPVLTMIIPSTVQYYRTSSADDYLRIEQKINSLAHTLQMGYAKYPMFKFTPAYANGEISSYLVTGVSDIGDVDKLAICLMQLNVLGNAAQAMNSDLMPSIPENEVKRISKKQASR
jgi:hypothetical protein